MKFVETFKKHARDWLPEESNFLSNTKGSTKTNEPKIHAISTKVIGGLALGALVF